MAQPGRALSSEPKPESALTASTALRALLVEDNAGDRRLLEEFLADAPLLEVTLSHATRLGGALQLLGEEEFDLVFLDLLLPDGYGVDSLVRLRAIAPSVKIVVLTGIDDVLLATRALREGAADYLVKGRFNGATLVETTLRVLEGSSASIPVDSTQVALLARLTQRELEIASLVGRGNEPASIAQDLGISLHTVRNHLKKVYRKLEVHSQIELVHLLSKV